VRLAKNVSRIPFEYNYEKIKDILNDIIDNPDTYADKVNKILLDCIEYKSNYNEKYTRSFINDLKGAKNA